MAHRNSRKAQKNKRLRAVYYARVSTEEEKQVNALAKQIQENRDVIASKGWELVDEYVDEGKSGTKVKGRTEYQRLLADMNEDKFDIIVIKSQDRLQRNTKDWYIFADHLNKTGKRLFLYMENKFFIPSEDALITGIKAILAEEYSRDLSKKLNNAKNRRIEAVRRGERVNAMGNGQTYGYRIKNKRWVIEPKEAELVRKMYELYLELHSIRKVRDALNDLGYRNRKGNLFTEEVVGRIIKNEMHKGWIVTNRHHRNFETKEIEVLPEEEWAIDKNDHEPIVSEEIWDTVNNEIQSHKNSGNSVSRGRKVGSDLLSGKMYCASCGKVLWRHKANGYTNWYCSGKMGRGEMACDNPATISSVQIRKYLVTLADKCLDYSTIEYSKALLKQRTIKWLKDLKDKLSTPNGNDNDNVEAEIAKLEKRQAKLLDAYTEDIISKEEFREKKAEIAKLIADKKALIVPVKENEDIKSIDDAIRNIDKEIELLFADEALQEENKIIFIMKHIKKIKVCTNKDVCVVLDKVAGAFLFIDGGKTEMFISPADGEEDGEYDDEGEGAGEVLPFVRQSTDVAVADEKYVNHLEYILSYRDTPGFCVKSLRSLQDDI